MVGSIRVVSSVQARTGHEYFFLHSICWTITKKTIFIPRRYFLPESPRWLLENGKIDELIKVITIAARWNQIELPAGFEKTLHQPEQTLTVSFVKLFQAKYCRTTLLMIIVWYALILIYFGLTLHLAHLGGDIYITTVSPINVCLKFLGNLRRKGSP